MTKHNCNRFVQQGLTLNRPTPFTLDLWGSCRRCRRNLRCCSWRLRRPGGWITTGIRRLSEAKYRIADNSKYKKSKNAECRTFAEVFSNAERNNDEYHKIYNWNKCQ